MKSAAAVQPEFSFVTTHRLAPMPGRKDKFILTVETRAVTGGERVPVAEVARELGLAGRTVRFLIDRGDLRAHRPGRSKWYVWRRDLEAYKARRGMVA